MDSQRLSPPQQPRVLVVDDVPAMRQFLRLMLGGGLRRATIDEAGDGIQALRLATQNLYDLLLLDLNLPLLDGMKVLAALRAQQQTARTPVMIVSTVHDADTLRRARDLSVAQVMPKPVDAAALLDVACELLGIPVVPPPREERRLARRVSIRMRLRFGDGADAFEATTWDISPAGAFVVSDRLMPLGTHATAELVVPHLGRPLDLDCEVVRVRPIALGAHPPGFGVRFRNVTRELADALATVFTSPKA
jgi:two-component system, chemotaxis family, chemotaxis protein CheY